jgi:urea-proton symporter
VDFRLASFLLPWGVVLYTATGGLTASYLASYFHSVVIYVVLAMVVFIVYMKNFSTDTLYGFLAKTTSYNQTECESIFSVNDESFFEPGKYACGAIPGNEQGSALTMLSKEGLMFGIINIVGNFGTVFVDQSYWQSSIAARPESAVRGYILAG